MSATTTETSAKAQINRLPAKIFYKDKDNNRLSIEIERVIANIVKKGGIVKSDSHSAEDIAKRLLITNFRSFPKAAEIPAEFDNIAEDLDKANTLCAGIVAMNNEIKKLVEEEEKTRKQQADAEKQAAKDKKDAEDKQYNQNESDFEAAIMAHMPKSEKLKGKITEAIISSIKMPGSIALTDGGMGLTVSSNASKAEIAAAITTSITVMGSLKDAEGALQFQIGDAVNAAVNNGVYRKKGDAASHIKNVISEKCGKDYGVGHIQVCALMAERTPVGKRQRGVNVSNYIEVSKLSVPRIKDSGIDEKEAQTKIDSFRDELLEEVNSGANLKTLKEKIQKFKEDNKFVKQAPVDNSARVKKLQERYVWAELLMDLTVDDEVVVMRGKDKKTYTTAELTEIRDESRAELRKLLLEDNYDVKALRKGVKDQEIKGEIKEAPYRMGDPLWEKEVKKEEPKKEEEPEQVEGITEVETTGEESPEVEAEVEVETETSSDEDDSIEFGD